MKTKNVKNYETNNKIWQYVGASPVFAHKNGITLIALVITIIVIIILAGVSINLLFGDSGVINIAKESQLILDIATAQERLELVKTEIPTKILDNKDNTVNLKNYLEELRKDKNIKNCSVTSIEELNEINAEILISGKYKFLAHDTEKGDVEITYLGEAGGLQISLKEQTYIYPISGTFEVTSNESQGKLSVKSENENIAKASISGNTVTVEPQNMPGETNIIVTSEANGKYAEGRVTHKAKVENGEIILDAEVYTGIYDTKAHNAITSIAVVPEDALVEYALGDGAYTSTIPTVTGTGTYTISIRASKTNYITKEITKTVTVNADTTPPTAPTIAVTSGTSGNNGWYRSNITIKITEGSDSNSGVQKVTYTLSGATTKTETTIASGGTFTITNDGTTKVTAYTYDNAGNKSSARTLTVKKDATAPTTPSIQITNITINSSGWSYTISTGSSDTNGVTYRDGYNGQVFGTTTNNSLTISGNGWFSYGNIMVKAQDVAGNESWSSSIYLNAKRLYIRQLFAALRNNNNVTETEVSQWDLNYGKGAIIVYGIFGSTESTNLRNSIGISSYIDRLYLGILGRTSDSGGKSHMQSIYNQYDNAAQGNSYMILEFVNSAEAQNIFNNQGFGAGTVTITECYNTFDY